MLRKDLIVNAAIMLMMAAFIGASADTALACSSMKPFSFDDLFAADVIVAATADDYVGTPDLSRMTTGVPDARINFTVEEVIKGTKVPESITLNGYLSDKDDYNDQKVPYKFVRKNGRSGSCFANTYKKGRLFLLFLKKTDQGFTPNISPLGPTNEQLRGPEDDWLVLTREEAARREKN